MQRLPVHRVTGLSPLTRGNLVAHPRRVCTHGPIPAHAGEPVTVVNGQSQIRAYPRSRGGTDDTNGVSSGAMGLSPLTRGNRRPLRSQQLELGPIPAHAGEPPSAPPWRRGPRAYPRSRGGTAFTLPLAFPGEGLSPLTRGNRALSHCQPSRAGLSPLTRGNRSVHGEWPAQPGPIPAHAGEPEGPDPSRMPGGAYPRSRGGTAGERIRPLTLKGLSPLTRGNRLKEAAQGLPRGPIPAHAGEPYFFPRAIL